MEENAIFEPRKKPQEMSDKKPVHTASLVVGILSLVFAFLYALAGDILGIVGIVMASNNRRTHNTTAALVCSIIGLVLALCNHIITILLLMASV